jgi:hypothetical protein
MYSKSRNVNKVPVIPKISPVTLALQLVSGERLIADFHPEGCNITNKMLSLFISYQSNFSPLKNISYTMGHSTALGIKQQT